MKNIILKRIEISNFKGITSLDTDFGYVTKIAGANGVGKSSINDAFNWCLFGTNAQGSIVLNVRPLNECNELIPDLEVNVSVILEVDGRATSFTRILGAGKVNNTATYCVNDVPCKMAEFEEKLNAICKKEDLKLLTSISAFNSLDTKSARSKLQQISRTVSDGEIARGFPAVLKAFEENKTVDELKREVLAKKQKSNDRLKQIPTAINAQEELRPVGLDFENLRSLALKKEKEIALIDAQLQKIASANQGEYDKECSERKVLNNLKADLQECEASISSEHNNKKNKLEEAKSKLVSNLSIKNTEHKTLTREITSLNKELTECQEKLSNLSIKWSENNESDYKESLEPICSLCKRPYSSSELSEMKFSQIEDFNSCKLKELSRIEKEAEELQNSKKALNFNISESQDKLNEINKDINKLELDIKSCEKEITEFSTLVQVQSSNKEWLNLIDKITTQTSKIANITSSVGASDNELSTKKETLKMELSNINKDLGKESLNEEIDKRKKELLDEEKTLAQAVADCDNIENQIKNFGKRRIEMVEEAISSLFKLVRFKMYEPNITNDGEKEICECIVDGVPFSSLNTAKRINAGIDIINGLSKALGVVAPIFIDNKESVSELIETDAQLITIEVVEGSELLINK